MLRTHEEKRKGGMHTTTKKTSKSFSGLSRLSVLKRLSEVLAEEAAVHLLWLVGGSQGLAGAVVPPPGRNTPVWRTQHPCSGREQPSAGSPCSAGAGTWAEVGAGSWGISISSRGDSRSLASAPSSQRHVRLPARASTTAGVRGRKPSPAWHGRVALSNKQVYFCRMGLGLRTATLWKKKTPTLKKLT